MNMNLPDLDATRLDRGLGAAGVGVASGTVKGVPDLPLSTIRATLPALRNPFRRSVPVPLNSKQFHYAFASLRRDAPTKVDFGNNDRAPLLFIAFEHDHIIPPKASRHNAEKYAASKAITDFREFAGRPHFPGVPDWEAVADYALDWAIDNVPESSHAPANVTLPRASSVA